VAVRAFGRFEKASFLPVILPLLDDADARVRDEAINAACVALRTSTGDVVLPALKAFQAHNAIAAIGRLRLDPATADTVERWLLARTDASKRPSDEMIAALAGIGRSQTGRLLLPETQLVLRRAVEDRSAPPSVTALQALQPALAGVDAPFVIAATRYHCAQGPAECGWNFRLAAVQMLDKRNAFESAALDEALHDAAFQVRLAALLKLASCQPAINAINDAAETSTVRLAALTIARTCGRLTEPLRTTLIKMAGGLSDAGADWHEPARAFEALVVIDPTVAAKLLHDVAISHRAWQVRAAAARAAFMLTDDGALVTLSSDAVPNVRVEALTQLSRLKSPNLPAAALAALNSTDHQLLRQAATVMPASADRDSAVAALLRALDRLTGDGKDNSRDPRVAIIKRLQAFEAAANLSAYLTDFDPAVAAAAADALAASGQPRPTPRPTRRAPEQPTEAELRALPARATLTMADGGVMELDLLADQAPMAVARFVKLARAGYYDGLTFHRVEPLFVIQGGSPGASEYVGDARFMRDEVGTVRHVRGAVGISTRGRDTGDAQIFVDLIDVPRLNDDYTVFAQVRDVATSNTVLDRVLEGAVIKTVRIN
jgi:cyclophilin family peptidyl-prolyl cis-trans isomerase